MTLMNLVERIEVERLSQGISIKDLCKHAGIAIATYYHWVEGIGSPKISMISCVMDVLGMDIEVVKRGKRK